MKWLRALFAAVAFAGLLSARGADAPKAYPKYFGEKVFNIVANAEGFQALCTNVYNELSNYNADTSSISNRFQGAVLDLRIVITNSGDRLVTLTREKGIDALEKLLKYSGKYVTPRVILLCNPTKVTTNSCEISSFNLAGTVTTQEHLELGKQKTLIYGVTFENCDVATGDNANGGAISGGWGNGQAGYVVNCTFKYCKAKNGGAIWGLMNEMDTNPHPLVQWLSPVAGIYAPKGAVRKVDKDRLSIQGRASVYHCTFEHCEATGAGGAVYGDETSYDERKNMLVEDCSFIGCKAKDGGAVYGVGCLYRCLFESCTATGTGGGTCTCSSIVSCLFKACRSAEYAGACDSGNTVSQMIIQSTFIDCFCEKTHLSVRVNSGMGATYVHSCIFWVSGTDKNYTTSSFSDADIFNHSCYGENTAKRVFVAPQDDCHLRPVEEGVSELGKAGILSEPVTDRDYPRVKDVLYKDLYDLDGVQYGTVTNDFQAAGCYRYYTPDEWQVKVDLEGTHEWDIRNPFVVTTTSDIVNSNDYQISFREACMYAESFTCGEKWRSQWPRITFNLAGSDRQVLVEKNPVTLSDAKMRASIAKDAGVSLLPVVIDGGGAGVSFSAVDIQDGLLLVLGAAGAVSNVTFDACRVVADGNTLTGGGDRRINFANCAFAAGAFTNGMVVSRCGNVRFSGCTFRSPGEDASPCAVTLDADGAYADYGPSFECCTFTGFRSSAAVLVASSSAKGGKTADVRFANCTFARNACLVADVLVAAAAPSGNAYFLNCIFADRDRTSAVICDSAGYTVHCPFWKSAQYGKVDKGTRMANIASARPLDVLESQDSTATSVRGVSQWGFLPKHMATARYGQADYTFENGVEMRQPERDIFGHEQPGPWNSMGSLYFDDVETVSVEVTTPDDVYDRYDDLISLREAMAYGVENGFYTGTTIRPTYSAGVFSNGVVELTVTGAIPLVASVKLDRFTILIAPNASAQTLTITSGKTRHPGGIFRQGEGTEMHFADVTFRGCRAEGDEGGVLSTAGRFRFDRCRFEECTSGGSGGAIRLGADTAEGIVYDATARKCRADEAGGFVWNECGTFMGVNLTLTENAAPYGAAIASLGGVCRIASSAIVDNTSTATGGEKGAVYAGGGRMGLVNSIVIANTGGNVVRDFGTEEFKTPYSLTEGGKGEVFANNGEPVPVVPSNSVEQLYYPLAVRGAAHGAGAYVFFAGEHKDVDSRMAGWLSEVFYSTDPDGFSPKAEGLFGSSGRNTYLIHDQLGNLIECLDVDGKGILKPSMGPVPQVAAVAECNIVTTVRDDVSATEGVISFRVAAEFAISNDMPLVISDELFSDGKAVFELSRQIDVPRGKKLRIDAGSGRTVELRPAEGKETNRFFNVSGTLSAIGLTFRDGYSRSAYESMSLRPVNDDDGGAVWGGGQLAFTNCVFIGNRAKGGGGAIYSHGGLSLENCTFSGNQAGWDGGAVYSDREKLSVTQTEISANSAVRLAGGLFVRTEDVSTVRSDGIEVIDSRIVGNEAGGTKEAIRAVDWVKFEGSDVGSEDGVPVVVMGGTASGADSVPVANVVIGILGAESPDAGTVAEPESTPAEPVIAESTAPVVIDLTGGESAELPAMTVRQGQSYGWAVTSASGAKVSARGLPKGMKLVSRAIKEGTKTVGRVYSLEGAPSKAGVYTVTFKTVLNRKTTVSTQTFTVLPLADWAQGVFDGGSEAGLLTLKVSSAGKLNGQYQEGGRKWKLSASAYDRYDEGAEVYVAKVVGKSGSGKKAVLFTNELSFARDSLGGLATNDLFLARLNMWKQEPWKAIGRRFPKKDGEIVLRPGVVSADDTVTLKFAASGKVSVKGVFGGKSVTGRTSVLCPQTVPDAVTGAFDGVAFVYIPPKKGASLASGYAACVRVRWDGVRFGLIEE